MSKRVSFPIEDASWHGYTSEALACEELGDFFRVSANPLFIQGLAKGDLIRCHEVDGELKFTEMAERSGNWTYRVIMTSRHDIDGAESFVREIYDDVDFAVEMTDEMVMFSLCVPPVAVRRVYSVLQKHFDLGKLDFEEANLGILPDS